MSTTFVLKLLLYSLLPAGFGYLVRKSFPRAALFLLGFPIGLLGLWAITSTLELAEKGQAHTFSRHYTIFSKVESPESFEWSFWLHLILGGFIFLIGVAAVVLPLTPRGSRIKFDK